MFLLFQDDENVKLCEKIKELEEDRARLQRTTKIQQTQMEKHKVLAEESAKKCEVLQLQVSALQKVCVGDGWGWTKFIIKPTRLTNDISWLNTWRQPSSF